MSVTPFPQIGIDYKRKKKETEQNTEGESCCEFKSLKNRGI
jgi:hypothetical protein